MTVLALVFLMQVISLLCLLVQLYLCRRGVLLHRATVKMVKNLVQSMRFDIINREKAFRASLDDLDKILTQIQKESAKGNSEIQKGRTNVSF